MRNFLIVAMSLLLVACGGKPEHMGVEINGEYLPVIDMHMHTGTWENTPPGFRERLTGRVPRGFKWTMGPFVDWNLSGSSIVSQMDNAGISRGAIFALWSPPTTGIATNDFVAEVVSVAPDRLYSFASLRVDHWNIDGDEQLQMLEDAITTHGMKGIKLAHAHMQMRLDDRRFDGIYEIAGRLNTPIYMHTGTSPNPGTRTEPPYCDPAYLEEIIRAFPDTTFILGHTGYDTYNKALTFVDSALELAERYSNVYFEPGALGAERADEVRNDYVRRVRDFGVIDKMIYGSDGVQFPGYLASHLETFVGAMVEEGYTTEEIGQVLSGNFVRVFEVEPVQL